MTLANKFSEKTVFNRSVFNFLDLELSYLSEYEDVIAILLFRLDGQVLKTRHPEKFSPNLLIISSWVKSIISKTMEELQSGSRSIKYNKMITESIRVPVYFYLAGRSSILVIVLQSKANTGLMEIEMSRSAKRIGLIIDTKKQIGG
ncbi:hypothetical protein [Candidatus Hodarchaeum mangrovi]